MLVSITHSSLIISQNDIGCIRGTCVTIARTEEEYFRLLSQCNKNSRVFLQRYVHRGLGVDDKDDDDAPARHSPSTKFALCVNSCELLLLLLLLLKLLLLCV